MEGDHPVLINVLTNCISIHALRVEGDAEMPAAEPFWHCISIHALRVEGDPEVGHIVKAIGISIHALRVEGDERLRASMYFIT